MAAISVAKQWNPKQALLKSIIIKPDKFDETIKLVLELHSKVHTSEMSNIGIRTFEDEIWDGLNETIFTFMPAGYDTTIAWDIWHMTRIEDITANILIAGEAQVINSDNWLERMKVNICDTGNAMANDEIKAFSSAVDMEQLKQYRVAVGRKTRYVIANIKYEDLKRKIISERIKRVLDEGGVTNHKDSIWLLDFWGRKNVAGILQMPITRHQIVHINDSLKIKEKGTR